LKMLFSTGDDFAPVFLRVALGTVMFAHGAQKVLGWFGGPGLTSTIDVFTNKLHFPLWSVILLLIVEFLGSLGLIAGFLTRLTAIGLSCSMSICAYMNHIQNGFFLNWFGQQKGEGIEYHLLVLGICLFLLVQGSGSPSVDRRIMRALA
jgi:putative oxidoreductase